MNRYAKLVQQRADLVNEARTILAVAEKAGRELTDDEKVRDDEIAVQLSNINAEIERIDRLHANEAAVAGTRIDGVRDLAVDDPKRGFTNLADFAIAVREASLPGGQIDDRLRPGAAPTDYLETGGSAGEGYMIPPAMRDDIWEIVTGDDSLLNDVETEPTSSNSVTFAADETTPWGATGVSAHWRSEGTQMTPSRLETDGKTLRLHELYAFVLATEELLEDAPRLNARLTSKAGQALRYKTNEAIVRGTGAGQPLGWMNSAAKVAVAKETGQAAATVVAANVAKMYARIINPAQAIWYINQDVLPQLLTMTLGNQPIWTPPVSGFTGAPGGQLFGRPVRFLENADTVGNEGDIQLVNPKGYYVIQKTGGVKFAESMHLYFDYNMRAFRWTVRLNGQPFLSAPVAPAKGSNNRSHFVTLAVRA